MTALAYSEEAAKEVEEYLKIPAPQISYENTGPLYLKLFGQVIKQSCGTCVDDARYRILKWKKKYAMNNNNCPYRISKQFAGKAFTVNIGGTMHRVTAETITKATAEAIMSCGRYKVGVIEANPDYIEPSDKQPSGNGGASAGASSISSTLTEAPKDGTGLQPVAAKKNLSLSESGPTPEVKPKPKQKPGGKKAVK